MNKTRFRQWQPYLIVLAGSLSAVNAAYLCANPVSKALSVGIVVMSLVNIACRANARLDRPEGAKETL